MAITIQQKPVDYYPAFNDSWIRFSSDLSNDKYATVKTYPTTYQPTPARLYPDQYGRYRFNFKEIASIRAASNKYEVSDFPVDEWGKSVVGLRWTMNFTLEVFNDDTSETLSDSILFIRGSKGILDKIHTDPNQLLTPTKNGIDYHLTYFEGYPFSFTMLDLTSGQNTSIKNVNNGLTTTALDAGFTGSFMWVVDRGATNWTNTNYLPLTDTINHLEVQVNGGFKSNLWLKKVQPRCGVFLRWANFDGSHSYHLFDNERKLDLKAKSLGEINTNNFANFSDKDSQSQILGYETTETIKVTTTVDPYEAAVLKSLFASPKVEMWTATEPFQLAEWVPVFIKGNYSISTKKHRNKIGATITLPNQSTPTW